MWQTIDSAPKDMNILGWGKKVGIHKCYWDSDQWSKCELSASFQLGPEAITHWQPLPNPPETE